MKEVSPFLPSKPFYRSHFRKVRSALSSERRAEAAQNALDHLSSALKPHQYVLSFVSLLDEIDLTLLNARLASEKRLLLPKTSGHFLKILAVSDLKIQLEYSSPIYEPNPALCNEVEIEKIDCILVPG